MVARHSPQQVPRSQEVTRSFKVLLSMVWSFAVSLLAMFDIHKGSVSCVVV